MTSLRQRMTQDLQLRGYADRTVEAYVRAVAQLATFYRTSPDRLGEEQIRQYLLHLSTVQHVARGTHTIALCGIKCFYQQTLGQQWTVLEVARPKRTKKLPVVLSRDEVWRILGAVRIDAYRVCLTTIYACGLRLMEGIRLAGAGHRQRSHVAPPPRQGRQGSLRPAARWHARPAANALAHASQSALALSGAAQCRTPDGHGGRRDTDHPVHVAVRSRACRQTERRAQAGPRAYAPA